jgi:hypothetical protein
MRCDVHRSPAILLYLHYTSHREAAVAFPSGGTSHPYAIRLNLLVAVRMPVEARIFLFSTSSRPALGHGASTATCAGWDIAPGPLREADH